MVVLSIAIPAVVFLALLLVFAASRRNEAAKAEGQLSKETLQRDISSEKYEPEETGISQISGKEIERAAVIERQGGKEIALQEQSTPVPWIAPDEETVGIARRQFLNRSIVALMGISLSSFGVGISTQHPQFAASAQLVSRYRPLEDADPAGAFGERGRKRGRCTIRTGVTSCCKLTFGL